MESTWICRKCGVPLENKKVILKYLGNNISHELPACPKCGFVLIDINTAEGRMREVETMLEDK
ncbi:MAG: DNA-binding protein [Oscillospiraceae bacterium]|nr:DNA-binding protein [Oscillospiraceae bacterium]